MRISSVFSQARLHILLTTMSVATGLLATAVAWSAPAADEEPLVSHRPGFGVPAATVPEGLFQVEGGLNFARIAESEDVNLGAIFAFYGVTAHTEVFVGLPSFSRSRGTDLETSEFQDLSVGSKHRLLRSRGEGARPEIVLAGALSIPVGGGNDQYDEIVPTIGPAFGWTLPRNWSVGATLLYAYAIDGEERFHQLSGGASAGYAFTHRLSAYLEWFAFVPAGADDPNDQFLDAGLAFLIRGNWQVDGWAGWHLRGADPDYFAGVGLTWRSRSPVAARGQTGPATGSPS